MKKKKAKDFKVKGEKHKIISADNAGNLHSYDGQVMAKPRRKGKLINIKA